MFPYSPEAAEDEPTMTDLRGVLPAQRPPVDATVLDEPTSEVPMIRPPADYHRNGEGTGPGAFGPPPVAEPELADTAELEPGETADREPDTTDLAADTTDLAADTVDLTADAADGEPDTTDLAAETAVLELPEPAEPTGSDPAADMAEPEQPEVAETAVEVAEPTTMAGPEPVDLIASEPVEWTAPEPVDLIGSDPQPEPAFANPVTADPVTADPASFELTSFELAADTALAAAPAPGFPGQPPLTTDTDHTDAVPGTPDQANPEVPTMVEPTPPHRISEMAKMTWSPADPRLDRPEPAMPRVEPEPERFSPVAASALPVPAADLAAPPVYLAGSSTDLADLAEPAAPATLAEPDAPAEPTAAAAPDPAAGPADRTEPAPPGRPGDVPESTIALWSPEAAVRLREQWRDLQVQFIDDPEAAVAGAKGLVTEAVHELADTLLEAQDALDPYRDDSRTDTETMRVAMRRYREFLERVLAL